MCTGFFFGAEEDLNSNDDDRSQRLKQGGVVGAGMISKPCQGAAEKSANATGKALTTNSLQLRNLNLPKLPLDP